MVGTMNAADQRRFDLIGIGECMVEFFSEEPLNSAKTLQRSFGGDVLNSLVSLTRLGGRSGFITRVGSDPFGAGLLDAWAKEQINTECAPQVAGDNGVYFISVTADGEREFTYRRQSTPASQITPADLNEAYIASSHWLLLSGITQALSPSARATTLAAARMAKENGVKIAYDPNYRPRLWANHGGIKAAREAFHEIAQYADWLLPSHPADGVLLGEELEDNLEVGFATAKQFATFTPNVALKCGPDGVIITTPNSSEHVQGVKAVKVVDTTGAGDCWNGTFLYKLQCGRSPAEAAQAANQNASDKIAYRGAIPPIEFFPKKS
jgi:2-dehydro-3-deoxygluconokinase